MVIPICSMHVYVLNSIYAIGIWFEAPYIYNNTPTILVILKCISQSQSLLGSSKPTQMPPHHSAL